MDSEDTGINGKIKKFATMFRQIDKQLYDHIDEQNVQPNFYSLRWLMLMMAQEFELLNVIKVWDTLLADSQRWNFVYYIAVAGVQLRRDVIMKSEFSEIMEALQRNTGLEIDETDYIEKLLSIAKKMCLGHTRKYDYFIEKTK